MTATAHRAGPRGRLRVCHQELPDEYGRGLRTLWPERHFCELTARQFCWTCDSYYCITHALTRHEGHHVERIPSQAELN